MNRKGFIRNALMGLAISLVPKILQPILPEPKKVFSWGGLTELTDEYQLTTLKMQSLVNRLRPMGVYIWWENEQWKQLRDIRSQTIEEIRQLIQS